MTSKPDTLTEAQERLLLSLPTEPDGDPRPAQKLLALGLAVWANEEQTMLAHTEAGTRRAKEIKESAPDSP